jgi:hypothetical protein
MGFAFGFLKPTDPYYPAWQERRRRLRGVWLAFGVTIPGTVLLLLAIESLFGPGWEALALLPIALAWILPGLRYCFWPCPRCGKPFYAAWWLTWPTADRCLHCGLPEYSPDGEVEAIGRRD